MKALLAGIALAIATLVASEAFRYIVLPRRDLEGQPIRVR